MQKGGPTVKERVIWLDCLRCAAAFAVVCIHVCAQNWFTIDISSMRWMAFHFYDCMVRWAVPAFVMISGAFFLDPSRELSLSKLYRKYILRIFTALVFWSFAYAAVYAMRNQETFTGFLRRFLYGHYHLWYLYMLLGLYIITPLVRKITADRRMTEYFLAVGLILTVIVPDLLHLPILDIFTGVYDKLRFHFTLGYVFYYVLGYYLAHVVLTKRQNRTLCLFGVVGYLIIFFGTWQLSLHSGQKVEWIYDYLSFGVALESAAVMVFFRNRKIDLSAKARRAVSRLSKYSFGVYLVHIFVLDALAALGFSTVSFNSFLAVPAVSVVTFVISLGISMVLNRIPVLSRYIV